MFRFPLIVRYAGCAAVVAAGACAPRAGPIATPLANVWESPGSPAAEQPEAPPERGPATQPAGDAGAEAVAPAEVIAVVNGSPIARQRFVDMLTDSHGLGLLEQLILLTAARQRAAQMSLTVTEADIAAAHAEALRRLATPISNPDGQMLDRAQARRLLDEFLTAKNISRSEWDCRMQQWAYLRKIAEAEVNQMDVTEEMLREEYDLAYGEKVQVRHIQVSSLALAGRVRALLADKKDFELVARQLSENEFTAAGGGLTRPFTRDDPGVTPLLREAAFNLEVGQVSETIRDGDAYHIIRLERRFPASDVGFENVDRDQLRRRLVRRLVRQRQQALENELFRDAKVDIRHPGLRRQFHEKYGRLSR